jgi:hypothetical protein
MKAFPGFVLLASLALGLLGSGCSISDRQMAKYKEPTSKSPKEIFDAADAVLRERYYQVKSYRSTMHDVVLTPVVFDGNQPSRKRIDVYVLMDNGYYMPFVSVAQFVDVSEPPEHNGGPIVGHLPIGFLGTPGTTYGDSWQSIGYDHTEEASIRKAILERLKIPS